MKNNLYSEAFYYRYYVNTPFVKFKIANLYYLWFAYFCLIKAAGLKRNSKVLDFGCGIGNQVWALRKFGINATGIDSSKAIKKYCRSPSNCIYKSTKKLPFKDSFFDLVYSFQVLEHLDDKELNFYIQELYRISRGTMIHIVGVSDIGKTVTEEKTHKIVKSEKWWEKKFKKMGYKVKTGNIFYFFPNLHEVFTNNVNLKGIRSGYFYMKKSKTADR